MYLHRIYDQHQSSFNLRRFLITIRENPHLFAPQEVKKRVAANPHAEGLIRAIGALDPAQLERDIRYCTNSNPQVANLNEWRDRVTFHKDPRELFRQNPFEHDHPLPFAEIEELLAKGYEIRNRYSQYFDTSVYSQGCREWKDVNHLFNALAKR